MIIKVNFGNENSALPSDEFILDFGQGYSEKGYGWVTQASLDGETAIPIDLLTNTRDRDVIDEQSTDTLIHLQYPDDLTGTRPQRSIKTPSAWEYDLENGTYQITVSVGDPEFTDSNHVVNIEGESAIAGFAPTENELFREVTTTVEVTDGKLTLDAIGGENTKLNFVEIVPEDSIESSDSDSNIDESTTPEATIPDTTETDGEEDTPTDSADTEGDAGEGEGEDSTPTDSTDTDTDTEDADSTADAVTPTDSDAGEGEDITSTDSTDTDSDGEEAVDGDGEGEGEDSTDSDAGEGENEDSTPTNSADTDSDGEEVVDGEDEGEDSTSTDSTDTDTEDTDSTPDAVTSTDAGEGEGDDSTPTDSADTEGDDTEDTDSTADAVTPTESDAGEGEDSTPIDSADTDTDTEDTDSTPDAVTATESDSGEGEDITSTDSTDTESDGEEAVDGDGEGEGEDSTDSDAGEGEDEDSTPADSADTDSDGEEVVDGEDEGEDSTSTDSTDTETEDTGTTADAVTSTDSDAGEGEDSTSTDSIDTDSDTEDTGTTPDAVTPTDSDAGEGEIDSNTDSVTSEEDSEGDISADPEGTGSDVPENTDTSGDAGGEVGIPVEGGGVVETVEPIDGGFNFNFGVPRVDGPSGFTQDLGEAYDTERGYGWVTQESAGSENLTPVDVVVNGRDRDTLFNDGQGGQFREPVRDSLIHMQYPTGLPNSSQSVTSPAAWEYEIADGQYEVTVGVGDPTFFDSNHVINVEGENLISGFAPTGFEVNGSLPVDGQAFSQSSGIVEVTDGSLTLDAIGGENTKVNYISIIPVDAT